LSGWVLGFSSQLAIVSSQGASASSEPSSSASRSEFRGALAVYLAARKEVNRAWAHLLLAEHKAAWEKGVADAEKYVPLLGDLFRSDEAA
jgi:hypothetical protein